MTCVGGGLRTIAPAASIRTASARLRISLGNHDGRAFSGCVKPDLVLSVPVGKPNEKRQMRRNVSEEIARLLHLFVGSLEYRKDVVP